MTKSIAQTGLLVLAFMLDACIETFYPDIDGQESILVVDGMVTDAEDPCLVRLSRIFSYDDQYYPPEKGATVIILDGDGMPHYLEEKEAGSYYTDTASFRGRAGGRYQLQIILADGTTYQSDYVTLKKAPPVESFDVRYEAVETRDRGEFIHGLQFYLNTYDPENETRYYRWEWTETWEFTVPMQAPELADRYRCWKSHKSSSILIANTKHLTADRIIDYPLHFVSTESNRLRILYSLLVRQYAISPAAYEFWKTHEELEENAGTLFDPIPARVAGNIYNIDDPGEQVLGFFEASGLATRRIFVSNDLIPENISIPSDFEFCKFMVLGDPTNLPYWLNSGWILVDEYYDMNRRMVRLTNSPKCYDCTLTGSNERPDYWPAENEK
jgi:hypothetical protein